MSKRSNRKLRMFVAIVVLVACHALASQALSATCTTVSGTTGSASHAGALAGSSTVNATCTGTPTCAGPTDTGGRYNYDLLGFKNNTGSTVCYVVNVAKTAGCTSGLFSAAYKSVFNAASLCTNYLADTGTTAVTTNRDFSFNVPTGTSFYIDIEKYNRSDAADCGYTMTLSTTSCTNTALTAVTVESFSALGSEDGRVLL